MAKKDLKTKHKNLNAEQKKFCEVYVTADFFCNGVESYIEAYGLDQNKESAYNTAKSNAYKLLTQDKILEYIDDLLDFKGLNDGYVDKQLLKLISQDAEKSTKLGAIKEYNNLRARIEKGRQKALDDEEITKGVIPQIIVNGTIKKENTNIIE